MTRSSIWDIDRDEHYRPPFKIIPGAVCTHCRRFDYTPITPNNKCYWCRQGTFTNRGDWNLAWCPVCDGDDFFCTHCHGTRIAAIPLTVKNAG